MGRKCHDAKNRIDNPPEEDLTGCITGIPLVKRFEGGDVLARGRILVIPGTEYIVQGMQERAAMLGMLTCVALGQAHIKINVDVMREDRRAY
jgi:hypothetical protein